MLCMVRLAERLPRGTYIKVDTMNYIIVFILSIICAVSIYIDGNRNVKAVICRKNGKITFLDYPEQQRSANLGKCSLIKMKHENLWRLQRRIAN